MHLKENVSLFFLFFTIGSIRLLHYLSLFLHSTTFVLFPLPQLKEAMQVKIRNKVKKERNGISMTKNVATFELHKSTIRIFPLKN